MTKEKLMEMGLTEEQATKVMEGLNGAFVPKSRFNEVNTELQTAKATIKERDTQLDGLKKSGADATALQEQITQLQAANAQKDKDHAAEIKKIRVDNAVKDALVQAGAINPATVTPLLAAFLEKADLAEDGTIKGLADEISKLAKTEGTSFLFKADTTPQTPPVSGASPAGSTTTPPDPKVSGYEARLTDARKAGNSALAIAIKREAAADGVQLF
ncbi:MAG: phage scaffolding protein [Ruminococcus flavefaciens]|nr:phage scaffolding protein [Ruminococcus flavefaciens]